MWSIEFKASLYKDTALGAYSIRLKMQLLRDIIDMLLIWTISDTAVAKH